MTVGDSATPKREPGTAARRARGIALLAAGEPVARVAEKCGVATGTVENWATAARSEIHAAAEAKIAGLVTGAAEAKRMLAEKAPSAAAVLLAYVEGSEPENAPGAGIRLRAAMTLLDRVGVPVLTKLEHSGEVVSEATLAKLRAALKAAKE